MATKPVDRCLTINEACEFLGYSRSTLNRMRKEPNPPIKFQKDERRGRNAAVRVRLSELERYLASTTVTA